MPLSDWTDLSPSAITPSVDDTTRCWEPVVGGPLSSENLGRTTFEVWGRPDLIVGPYENAGQYTDIQTAINALAQSQHTGIYILNGSYTLAQPLYLTASLASALDAIKITGESQDGVKIYNTDGVRLIELIDFESQLSIETLSIVSANVTPATNYLLYCHNNGSDSDNTADVILNNVKMDLASGDYGIYFIDGDGELHVTNCKFNNGAIAIKTDGFDNVIIDGGCGFFDNGIAIQLDDIVSGIVTGNRFKDFTYYGVWGATSLIGNEMVADSTYLMAAAYLVSSFAKAHSNTMQLTGGDAAGVDTEGIIVNAPGTVALTNLSIIANTISIAKTTTFNHQSAYGIRLNDCHFSEIKSNNIKINTGNLAWGAYLWDGSSNNKISTNSINMVNSNAFQIGAYFSSDSDENRFGSDNVIENAGIPVKDLGTDNIIGDDPGE